VSNTGGQCRYRSVVVFVVAAIALAVAFAATLVSGRDGVVAAIGIALFLVLGAFQAWGGDEGGGEPIDGAAGFAFWVIWMLVPWLVGILVARLVRRNRRGGSEP
jgi:hypothetical protein